MFATGVRTKIEILLFNTQDIYVKRILLVTGLNHRDKEDMRSMKNYSESIKLTCSTARSDD